jgi:hypothetical protein
MSATSKVNPLEGFWIYSNKTVDIPLVFKNDPLDTPPTKHVYIGWNAIGFSDTTPLSAKFTLVSVDSDWTQMIGFDADSQTYEVSIINGAWGSHSDNREMFPGKGYWLYMTKDMELAAISA